MRALLGLLLLLVQLAAVAPAPALAQAPDRVIVAFGDSLTSGLGVPVDQTYPALLGERLRREGFAYKVVNAGVSGDTTAGGLRRVDWALRLKPEIVILELGVNDALRGQNLASVRANLDQLVARFQAAGARVLVAGMRLPPNYGTPYADDFYRLFSEVARARNAPYLPFFLEGVGAIPRLNQADGIHPTAEGYALVVEHLWPFLVPLLRK
jgi:acyl-CoA thioesterase I